MFTREYNVIIFGSIGFYGRKKTTWDKMDYITLKWWDKHAGYGTHDGFTAFMLRYKDAHAHQPLHKETGSQCHCLALRLC